MKKNFLLIITFVIATILLTCNISIAVSINNMTEMTEEKLVETLIEQQGTGGTEAEEEETEAEELRYTISDLYAYITRIPPKTEIKDFKSEFDMAEDQIHIYNDATLKEEVNERIYKNRYVCEI